MNLYRVATGAPVFLGAKLGKGGEGSVYLLRGTPGLVAKIYAKPPTLKKAEKLRAMVSTATPQLLRVAAWPYDVLRDDAGTVRGFLMPRVTTRESIHELYNPKSRAEKFPEVDFRFVVRVATNLARAIALMHSQGHVIGDVNHGNALVARDGTVVIIDCDSFQIRDRIRTYSCDVGVPLFTPPELHGQSFRGLRRTVQHDAFGLAVLVFHLLFMGRHPYAGRSLRGEMPIERAIAERRFAYGRDSATTGMEQPPGTLALGVYGDRIAALFERAFSGDAAATNRPAPTEWVDALVELEVGLTICSASNLHVHPGKQPCCWCELEKRMGTSAFGKKHDALVQWVAREVESLWNQITNVQSPEPLPLASPATMFAPTEVDRSHSQFAIFMSGSTRLRVIVRGVLFFACALLALGEVVSFNYPLAVLLAVLGYLFYPRGMGKAARKRKLEAAKQAVLDALESLHVEGSDGLFTDAVAEIEKIKQQLLELGQERAAAIKFENVVYQRRRYLEQFTIDAQSIPGLSRADTSNLIMYRLKTAADIDNETRGSNRDLQVAPPLRDTLMRWYERVHANFQFQPNEPLDAQVAAMLDKRFAQKQEILLGKLRDGPKQLMKTKSQILSARTKWEWRIDEARARLGKVSQE